MRQEGGQEGGQGSGQGATSLVLGGCLAGGSVHRALGTAGSSWTLSE